MSTSDEALLLYIPVLHQGYLDFIARHPGRTLWVAGKDTISAVSTLHEEIRAINPFTMATIIASSGLVERVLVASEANLRNLTSQQLVSVRDGVSDKIIERYLPGREVLYDSVFLKWSAENVAKTAPAGYDRISTEEFDRSMMKLAREQAELSGDWWRQIGGVLVKNGEPHILTHNQHVPSQFMPYVLGDPRDFITAGTQSEVTTSLHVEQGLITEAAKAGIGTKGCSIYVPTFPCPMCAKLEAYSGIDRVFFAEGHASLDGESVLRANGVELVLVQE